MNPEMNPMPPKKTVTAKKIFKTAGKILSNTVTVILALIVICNLYIAIARKITKDPQPTVFGCASVIVASNSMYPELEVDDFVFIKSARSYEVGDVVTYRAANHTVTHRITDVVTKEDGSRAYICKGDYNNTADEGEIPESSIVGRVMFSVSGVGAFIKFLQSPLGMFLIILVGVGIIELSWYLEKRRGKDEAQ